MAWATASQSVAGEARNSRIIASHALVVGTRLGGGREYASGHCSGRRSRRGSRPSARPTRTAPHVNREARPALGRQRQPPPGDLPGAADGLVLHLGRQPEPLVVLPARDRSRPIDARRSRFSPVMLVVGVADRHADLGLDLTQVLANGVHVRRVAGPATANRIVATATCGSIDAKPGGSRPTWQTGGRRVGPPRPGHGRPRPTGWRRPGSFGPRPPAASAGRASGRGLEGSVGRSESPCWSPAGQLAGRGRTVVDLQDADGNSPLSSSSPIFSDRLFSPKLGNHRIGRPDRGRRPRRRRSQWLPLVVASRRAR